MEVDVLYVRAALYRAAVMVEGRAFEGHDVLGMGRERARRGHRYCWSLDVELDCAVDGRAVVDAVECPELERVVALLPVAHVDLVVPRAERPVGLGHLALCHSTSVDSETSSAPFTGERILNLDLVDIAPLIPLCQLVSGVDACELAVVGIPCEVDHLTEGVAVQLGDRD